MQRSRRSPSLARLSPLTPIRDLPSPVASPLDLSAPRKSVFAAALRHPAFFHAAHHPQVQALAGQALDDHKQVLLRMLGRCDARARDPYARLLAHDVEAAHGRPNHTARLRLVLERLLQGPVGRTVAEVCADAAAEAACAYAGLPYLALGEFAGASAAYLQLARPLAWDDDPLRPGQLSAQTRREVAEQGLRAYDFVLAHGLGDRAVRRALEPPTGGGASPHNVAAELVRLVARIGYDRTRGHALPTTRRKLSKLPAHELCPELRAAAVATLATLTEGNFELHPYVAAAGL